MQLINFNMMQCDGNTMQYVGDGEYVCAEMRCGHDNSRYELVVSLTSRNWSTNQ